MLPHNTDLARALQRSGKADEAREHVQRFQEITQEKIGTIFSDNYGEQGRYATAEDMQEPPDRCIGNDSGYICFNRAEIPRSTLSHEWRRSLHP